MIEARCHRDLPGGEVTGEPCQLPAGHDGPCRSITWAELQDMFDQADDGPLFEAGSRQGLLDT